MQCRSLNISPSKADMTARLELVSNHHNQRYVLHVGGYIVKCLYFVWSLKVKSLRFSFAFYCLCTRTKHTDREVAMCGTHTSQMCWGWFKYNVSSPTWHSFEPFLVLKATRQNNETTPVTKIWLLIILEAGISTCLKWESIISICWFLQHLLCYEKPETWYPLGFVVSELKWITELMGWSSQCIKVKQSDLYFKGCDYSGARLTDSRE